MLGDRALLTSDCNKFINAVLTITFNTGELKGVIERNDRDRIYIGVWDVSFY